MPVKLWRTKKYGEENWLVDKNRYSYFIGSTISTGRAIADFY
jgi:hypothetical protein